MSDMRATERLLEVAAEHVDLAKKQVADLLLLNVPGSLDDLEVLKARDALDEATAAIFELRRRGDTLVRADDLRNVLAYIEARDPGGMPKTWASVDFGECVDRLNNALGGKR